MKRIVAVFEVSDKKWETLCDTLQNLIDNGNSDLRVSEYQTYEEDDQYLDIMQREEDWNGRKEFKNRTGIIRVRKW